MAVASRSQAPAGPLPQTAPSDGSAHAPEAPKPNVPRSKVLAGTWRLNLDESDDPAKKLQQARRGDRGGNNGGRRPGMGGGWPGGGGMGGRGGYGGRGGQTSESDSDREKMHAFLEPAHELTITQKEPEIAITDDNTHKVLLYTDNRKVEKSKDQTHQEMDAKWEEYRLVAEGKDPRGNKYERSYEVLEGNQQLRETLFLKVGRNNTEVSIRYVYDAETRPASATNAH
jgi:hypothetical protein